MKKINNKGYLTIEIILAATIAFTIAFFLIEVTIDFSNASDNYYTETIFITDKALVSNNVKKNIQNDINENGIITNVSCNNNTCTITYNNNTNKELKYNSSNKKVEYNTYNKEVKNLTFKNINVYGNFNEGDYIRFVISFNNTFTKNNYDINILIYNGDTEDYEYLVDHIVDLYNENKDTTVINNNIEYQYATEVNLMNDRLGGTTEDLDGGNIRYYGATPNNYIDIGDRYTKTLYNWQIWGAESLDKCKSDWLWYSHGYDNRDVCSQFHKEGEPILWRIIGVFDGKVRIVRDESIGKYSYDTSRNNLNYGINQWGPSGEYQGADLMKLLNPGYDENIDENYIWDSDNGIGTSEMTLINNSLWWNSKSGICYNDSGNETEECDFTSTGLSKNVKDLIIDQTLYLGGGIDINIYANQAYLMERGTTVFYVKNPSPNYYKYYDNVERKTLWTGKVGLIYLSDYGYSTDLSKCSKTINKYDDDLCKKDNWLFKEQEQWTITPDSSRAAFVWTIFASGYSTRWGEGVFYYNREVFPVLMLSPDLLVKSSSEGTMEKPYIVKMSE